MKSKSLTLSAIFAIAAINSVQAESFSGLNKMPPNALSISAMNFASAGQLATLDGIPVEALSAADMDKVEGRGFWDIFKPPIFLTKFVLNTVKTTVNTTKQTIENKVVEIVLPNGFRWW